MRTACLPQAVAAVGVVAVAVVAAVATAAKLSVMNHPEAKPPTVAVVVAAVDTLCCSAVLHDGISFPQHV